jgi:hypothetical protein
MEVTAHRPLTWLSRKLADVKAGVTERARRRKPRSWEAFPFQEACGRAMIFCTSHQALDSAAFQLCCLYSRKMHTADTHTRERESAYETIRHAATAPLAGRPHRVPGRLHITPCAKHPDIANTNRSKRPGVAIVSTTCQATQAKCPSSSFLSGNTREHRRAIGNRVSVAAGSTDFIGHRRLPGLFRRESIWDLSTSPYQRLLPRRRIVHQDPLGDRQCSGF